MFKTIGKMIKYPCLTQDYPKKGLDTHGLIGKPEIAGEKCNNCGECMKRCPSGAIVRRGDAGCVGINFDECVFCALCEDVCPTGAVRMSNSLELAEKDRHRLRSSTLVIEAENLPEIAVEELNAKLADKIRRVFGRSLQIREVDSGSCNGCDYEIDAMNNPFNDIERLGIKFVASPRHADLLLVTGTAARNMEQALIKTYHATPDPKLVVAVGACACSGGIFRDNYAVNRGIDCLVPVDAYIPGCPPRPQAILYGILKVLDRVK
jgi:Ni,Fe-hydrogenase III small subunit/Pyruvate/2-oxoacid:ferredoxin oxidoreductase delta subunit